MDWTSDDPDAVVVSRLIAAMNRVSGCNEEVRLPQACKAWPLHTGDVWGRGPALFVVTKIGRSREQQQHWQLTS